VSRRVIVARSLASTIRFHCPDDASAAALAFVAAQPEMPGTPAGIMDVPIVALGGGFYDFGEPFLSRPGTARYLVDRAHLLLSQRMVDEAPGAPLIHAGSLLVSSRRFLVVAAKGSGKTTLLLHCLSRGMNVESDEHVVVGDGSVTARPRTMRVKASSVDLITELSSEIRASPHVSDWNNNLIYSFTPETGTLRWRIAPGQADVMVFLVPNHGGLTSVKRLDDSVAFARLLDSAYLPHTAKGPALARLYQLTRRAARWQLTIGGLEGALWHLQQLAQL
jgi:hypothetical protein